MRAGETKKRHATVGLAKRQSTMADPRVRMFCRRVNRNTAFSNPYQRLHSRRFVCVRVLPSFRFFFLKDMLANASSYEYMLKTRLVMRVRRCRAASPTFFRHTMTRVQHISVFVLWPPSPSETSLSPRLPVNERRPLTGSHAHNQPRLEIARERWKRCVPLGRRITNSRSCAPFKQPAR